MRFWIEDEFIDKHARTLKPRAILVYVCLKRHCNKQGETTIGIRGIAREMGINKETASKGIKELELSGFVGQRKNKLSGFSPYTVLQFQTEVSGSVGHKELGIIKGIPNKKLNDEEHYKEYGYYPLH